MTFLLELGVLGLVASTTAQAADPKLVPPKDIDAAEVAAFEATVSRYTSRMNEFRDEARVMVHRQEAAERAELNRSYDAVLGQLRDDDDALRTTAIRRFEAFLTRYPEATHSAHVMFRLSELYFEKSEEAYEAADVAFQAALEVLDEGGDLEDIPDEPVKDYAASVDLHTQIIERFPDYEYLPGSYYMLGYMLREPSSAQLDEQAAQDWFRRLVDEYPESEFAPRAHLRLGDYHFEYNELEAAIPHYRQVVELEGVNGALYDDGLYKLAWTYYRLSEYEDALELLGKMLDWSETVWEPKKGRESSTVPEAIEYIAISLSDLAHDQERTPLAVAQQYFGPGSDRAYEPRIYKQLADVLSKQANYEEAIEVYEYFQQRWPNDADNPIFQHKIASLHMTKLPPDSDAADAAIATLNERFNDTSPWWRANRNNPDALAVARGFIEDSLATVAVNAHNRARESGAREDFLRAASLYGDYLKEFPFASDYYEIQWYYASVLQAGGDLDRAEREYEQLRKGGEHPFKEASLYKLRVISLQRVIDRFESVESKDPAAPVREEVATAEGKTRKVFELAPVHAQLIERTDALIDADFQPTLLELERQIEETRSKDDRTAKEDILGLVQPYADGLEANRPALEYQAGRVYYAHGDYTEARARLSRVVDRFPGTDSACYAASLDAESYLEEDDLVGYRQKVAHYMSLNLCQQDGVAESDDDFGTKLEQVDFELAARTSKAGDFLGAAEAYLEFYRTYPDSKYRKLALQNAANNYERGGRLDDSIRMLEQYVAAYPNDDNTRRFLFRLAGVYAQALDLDRAISSYEQLYQRTKGSGYVDAPIALANAAYLRVGVGDFAGAARNYEEFGAAFPNQPDTEKQVFRAGEQWERVGPEQAIAFYRRYLSRYRGQNPDHEMNAVYKLAVLSEEAGARPREVETLWDDVRDTYARLLPTGQLSALGRHYAAHAEFRTLEADLEAFRDIRFSSNDTKNAELLESKLDALLAIDAKAAQLISNYKDFEYASGALYVAGEAYLAYSDMLFNTPLPKGLDEEEVLLYEEAIATSQVPLEDKGKARLVRVIDNAKTQKRWTQFQTLATNTLNARFPREFAPEKDEVRGTTASSGVKRAGPIPIRTGDSTDAASGSKGER